MSDKPSTEDLIEFIDDNFDSDVPIHLTIRDRLEAQQAEIVTLKSRVDELEEYEPNFCGMCNQQEDRHGECKCTR